ncbi:tnc-2 [Symbiodinium sp. KB8]|nr:tnc-2 [Symbiodinium sp. KB8]
MRASHQSKQRIAVTCQPATYKARRHWRDAFYVLPHDESLAVSAEAREVAGWPANAPIDTKRALAGDLESQFGRYDWSLAVKGCAPSGHSAQEWERLVQIKVSHGEFLQHLTSDKYMQNCLLAASVKCGPTQCARGSGDAYEAINAQYEQNMFVLKHLRNFHEYDKTGAGTISIPEMKAVLRTTTIGLTERDLKSVLKQVDADGDGSVSFPEYLRLAQKLVEMQNKTKGKSSRIPRMYLEPAALKQYTDLFEGAAGEDGAISLNQLQEFLQQHKMAISEERLTSIMKEVDDDESGVLELDEFLILLIKALGIKRRKVGPEQNPASQLRQEGWALGELKKVGYDCAALREAGFSAADLMDVCTARELFLGGVPVPELLAAGWDCRHAKDAKHPQRLSQLSMALAVGSRVARRLVCLTLNGVVLDGRHFEGFRSGSRGTVIDVDRESGCCRVAFDDSPSVPVKVAIRHLGAEVSGGGSRVPVFARAGKELCAEDQAGDALGEAIRACAEATTSLCAASMMEVVAVRQDMRTLDKDLPSSEQLAARMSRLEQRVQALDEGLGRTLPKERVEAKLADRISRLEQLQVSQPILDKVGFGGAAAAEALAEERTEIPPQVGPGSEEWPADGVPVAGFPGRFLPYAAKAQSLMPDLQFMHCPIQDLSTPRSRELSELVGELMQRMEANEVIYVHCWGGRGRSGVVAACLLGSMFREMTAAECLEMVQSGYSSRGSKADVGALAKSPQTDEQRQFVKLWLAQTRAAGTTREEDMRQQQRALQDLKSQFERSLSQLAEQLQEVVRSQSRLQTEIHSQARPHVEPGYSSALRTLTGNVEDLKSLMEHSPLHGRTRIDGQSPGTGGAASPQTLRPTASPAASSTGAFHFTSAQAFCVKCGSQHAADEIFCRKCGHKREQASAQEAVLVEASSPNLLRSR